MSITVTQEPAHARAFCSLKEVVVTEFPSQPLCVACGQSQEVVPLIPLSYLGTTTWICPQHLPVLIHNPQLLAGKLPGAEGLRSAEHKD